MTGNQKDYFERMASRYGANAILVPGATRFRNLVIDKAMRKTLTPIIMNLREKRILEVGCGVGRWTRMTCASNSVVAVDISRAMVKLAREYCAGLDCSFVVADASALPFSRDAFEFSISITVLQHVLSEKGFSMAISEIARCTRYGALIVDQMSSDRETLLRNVYCPIRILPAKSYIEDLEKTGLHAFFVAGVTYAPLAVVLTDFLASRQRITEGDIGSKVRASQVISEILHFVMGFSTLSAVFMPRRRYNPRFCLHTVLIAEKKSNKKSSRNRHEP